MWEIGLPDIQQPFIWPSTKVRGLFDSMSKGFPLDYLLFWANVMAYRFCQIGADSKQKIPRLLIVDRQQRLTSLYPVLKGIPVIRENYRTEQIYIAFRPRDQMFEVTDAAIQRDPEFIPDIGQLWSSRTSRRHVVREFFEQLRSYRPVNEEEEDFLSESIGTTKAGGPSLTLTVLEELRIRFHATVFSDQADRPGWAQFPDGRYWCLDVPPSVYHALTAGDACGVMWRGNAILGALDWEARALGPY
jgi:hypothetical protein